MYLFVVVIVVSLVIAALGLVIYFGLSSNPDALKTLSKINIVNNDVPRAEIFNVTSLDVVSLLKFVIFM